MPESGVILVAALSGRAIAQAVARTGAVVATLDQFSDADLPGPARRVAGDPVAGFDGEALIAAARALAPPGSGLVVGSGFEQAPGLLAALMEAGPYRLLGNGPDVVRAVKDPANFAVRLEALGLEELGISHPETRIEAPQCAVPEEWLVKRVGAAGGWHIAAWNGAPPPGGHYLQRRAAGWPVSVAFVADRTGRCELAAISRQWADPTSDAPFRYGGAVLPVMVPALLADRLAEAARRIAVEFGLIGLNSLDLLVDGAMDAPSVTVLEVNPRPGATLDLLERHRQGGVMRAHLDAVTGRRWSLGTPRPGVIAGAVAYADAVLTVPENFAWAPWYADLPHPGSTIEAGQPLCSVIAWGGDEEEAWRRLSRRIERIVADCAPRACLLEKTADVLAPLQC
ncbi:ATP-grasp domain-containing protein [Azospirillum lipoferum]|uniref:ATP-grasp domain-containing protein n=1 Tax=Azospirillum lipoferum TaxID=193 RepID=A0A5A9GJ30_AZOLI|nr:ATP-grasp domain-containing protein [Azospirillum lipoferum]KAA0594323.1 ATP-grasp domain-containing protein [Azospirillum lipoferum]